MRIKAMKQALEALELWLNHKLDEDTAWQAHTTLRQAIAEAEKQDEPVAYISNKRQRLNIELKPQTFVEIPTVTDWEMPLYMKPQQRTWVGLTDEEIDALEPATDTLEFPQTVRAIEAKLKEKNT